MLDSKSQLCRCKVIDCPPLLSVLRVQTTLVQNKWFLNLQSNQALAASSAVGLTEGSRTTGVPGVNFENTDTEKA